MKHKAALALLMCVTACSEGAPDSEDAAKDRPNAVTSVEEVTVASKQPSGVTAVPPPASNIGSKCLAGEKVVFTCPMKSGKRVSVCITGSGADRFAQYRFGLSGGPAELVWPATAAAGRLSFGSVPYSGGGEGQIIFTNGDTTYAVFSRIVRTNFNEGETNDPAITDGIIVKRGDFVLGELLCLGDQAEAPVHFELAKAYMDEASELIITE